MANTFDGQRTGLDSPGENWASITPHDSNALSTLPRAIYVGGAGDLEVISVDGTTVVFSGVPVGTLLPIRPNIVKATNTTATNLIAVW